MSVVIKTEHAAGHTNDDIDAACLPSYSVTDGSSTMQHSADSHNEDDDDRADDDCADDDRADDGAIIKVKDEPNGNDLGFEFIKRDRLDEKEKLTPKDDQSQRDRFDGTSSTCGQVVAADTPKTPEVGTDVRVPYLFIHL